MLVQGYMKSVLTYACSGERCSQIKDAFPGGHLTSAPKEGGGGGGLSRGGLIYCPEGGGAGVKYLNTPGVHKWKAWF